ncbi:mitochondrial glycoprotein [Fimicolochytrium jonesii]|uniref:mitochondrial glycoprotein n=1 Tax=Fimicolochytrium jonesii TaxID=1396493 RepID=UPI0022FF14BE|nr:mitochondrial glycoprotein [Fimicolochytrium jonesii]KAI8819543.1 mitochondrial glycoprotein [Fimicolochytrium jonesii]
MLFRAITRTVSAAALTRPLLARSVAAAALVRPAVVSASLRPFSSTPSAFAATSPEAQSLSKILNRELEHEKTENPEDAAAPEFLQEFKQNNKEWAVKDVAGSKEIKLVRTFNDEKITILFNTDALVEADELDLPEEGAEEDADRSLPVTVSIIIEKPSNPSAGALDITASITDGAFFIEEASFLPSTQLAHDETAQGDWLRRSNYAGPIFGDLDEGVQDQFHAYLEERGIKDQLATFIPEYVQYKEQREYQAWLENVSKFLKE